MAEDRVTRTSAKPVTEVQKAQLAAKTAAQNDRPTNDALEREAVAPATLPLDELFMQFILFRRAQIYKPRLGGNIGGSVAIEAAKTEAVLREFEQFVMWMREGSPSAQHLSEAEKDNYRWAVQQGLNVPEEIKAQL